LVISGQPVRSGYRRPTNPGNGDTVRVSEPTNLRDEMVRRHREMKVRWNVRQNGGYHRGRRADKWQAT
jgi:hypothetical protein